MTLTVDELARARADFESEILDQTCTIQTLTRAADGVGGVVESWNNATGIVCRLGVDTRASVQSVQGERANFPDSYVLHVANDQTIKEGDRVIAGGITYEVTHVKDSSVQWVMLKRAGLRRLDG